MGSTSKLKLENETINESSLQSFLKNYGIKQYVEEIIDIVDQIRSLANSRPVHDYRYCLLGSVISSEIVMRFCSKFTAADGYIKDSKEISKKIDTIFRDVVLKKLDVFSINVLNTLKSEIFIMDKFPLCNNLLVQEIESRNA